MASWAGRAQRTQQTLMVGRKIRVSTNSHFPHRSIRRPPGRRASPRCTPNAPEAAQAPRPPPLTSRTAARRGSAGRPGRGPRERCRGFGGVAGRRAVDQRRPAGRLGGDVAATVIGIRVACWFAHYRRYATVPRRRRGAGRLCQLLTQSGWATTNWPTRSVPARSSRASCSSCWLSALRA